MSIQSCEKSGTACFTEYEQDNEKKRYDGMRMKCLIPLTAQLFANSKYLVLIKERDVIRREIKLHLY